GDGGRGVEPRQPEPEFRQGGPHALAGPASVDARRRQEPGRPSARWRRGPHLGRSSSGHPVGQADQGCAHPTQQVDGQDDHPFTPREEEV
ncbi:MAG: LSU ribosomal protein L2p (L8e), partial [uncultured Sphingomonadaceae bacterium]